MVLKDPGFGPWYVFDEAEAGPVGAIASTAIAQAHNVRTTAGCMSKPRHRRKKVRRPNDYYVFDVPVASPTGATMTQKHKSPEFTPATGASGKSGQMTEL